MIDSEFVNGKVRKGLGSTKVTDASIFDITPLGVNIVEKQPEFKENFGFTVNLGIMQVNWGVRES